MKPNDYWLARQQTNYFIEGSDYSFSTIMDYGDKWIEARVDRVKKKAAISFYKHTPTSILYASEEEQTEFVEMEKKLRMQDAIALAFFGPMDKRKSKMYFDFVYDFFLKMKDQEQFFQAEHLALARRYIDYIDRIRYFLTSQEGLGTNNSLWRDAANVEKTEKDTDTWIRDFASIYPEVMNLLNEPFLTFEELKNELNFKYFSKTKWSKCRQGLDDAFHDEYFYLFSKWETNPTNFEKMKKSLDEWAQFNVKPIYRSLPYKDKGKEVKIDLDQMMFPVNKGES